MDIIISAPKGKGKTQTALAFVKNWLGTPTIGEALERTAHVKSPDGLLYGARELAAYFRDVKPDAILFDGALTEPKFLLIAVAAVKLYRETTGRPDTLAVYVDCQDTTSIVLSDSPRPIERDTLDVGGYQPTYDVTTPPPGWDSPKEVGAGYIVAINTALAELAKQDAKFGTDRPYSLMTWLGVLNEEVLEFTREVVNLATVDHTIHGRKSVTDAARVELIQVAAVALQILKSYFVTPVAKPTNEFKTVATGNTPTIGDRDRTREILVRNYNACVNAGYSKAVAHILRDETPDARNVEDVTPPYYVAVDKALVALMSKHSIPYC